MFNNYDTRMAIKADKELAKQNKREAELEAVRESEMIENNEAFSEWAKGLNWSNEK